MKPVEIGAARSIASIDSRATSELQARAKENAASDTAGAVPAPAVSVLREGIDTGPPPIDTERVAEIRDAIESGTYPILPQKIGDAMVAAGMLLRIAQ